MPRRALSVCTVPGCPELVDPGTGRCDEHRRQADRARGTANQRGYDTQHRRRFRAAVLRRDPICVICRSAPATVADHHPVDRRTLQLRGEDPNDPQHGRGLCKPCHDRETARHQPGGWNAR